MKTYRLYTINDETLTLTGDEMLERIENTPDTLYISYDEQFDAFFECVSNQKYWETHGFAGWGGISKK